MIRKNFIYEIFLLTKLMWHWPQFHQRFLFIKFFSMPIHQYTIWYYIYFSTFFNFSNLSAEEISAVGISQALSDKE